MLTRTEDLNYQSRHFPPATGWCIGFMNTQVYFGAHKEDYFLLILSVKLDIWELMPTTDHSIISIICQRAST